ncbi:hypothetical protein ONV78_11785 [Hahella sp. CR1]|uniref:hypothetical protein n=1 Tax=Hahella sp. CR1 TaxID=2992807 RepID=UPI0024436F16|nr:hypothetical protein [Hahella sp. CR1]MDG9668417.1 hypothetical protein [Hahella sp. CR1]
MTERVKCQNLSCDHMILPGTAERTGGLCMPCALEQEREVKREYIRKHSKVIDPYAGLTDRIDIIKAYHLPAPGDPLITYTPFPGAIDKVYQALTGDEAQRLAEYAAEQLETDEDDSAIEIGITLAAFTDADLAAVQKCLLSSECYEPAILFRGASEEVVNLLVERLGADPDLDGRILEALAWSEDRRGATYIAQWTQQPPDWAQRLNVPVISYMAEAGWTLDRHHQSRKLYLDACYALGPTDTETSEAIRVGGIDASICPWCEGELTRLFDFNLQDLRLALFPWRGNRLILSTCLLCACFAEEIYMHHDQEGEPVWSSHSKKSIYSPDYSEIVEPLATLNWKLSYQPRKARFAAVPFVPTTFSQIGGMPTWEQRAAYPDCPECHEVMTFIGQLNMAEVAEFGEGTYYAFLCPGCRISATNYQQT